MLKMNNTYDPQDKTITEHERRQITEAANQIINDSGFGKLSIEFVRGEIRLIEITITHRSNSSRQAHALLE